MYDTLKDITADVVLEFLSRQGYTRQNFQSITLDQINSDMWKDFYSNVEKKKKKGRHIAEEPNRMFFLYKNSYKRNILVEYTSKTFVLIQLNENSSKILTDTEHYLDSSWKGFLKMRRST